MFSTEIVPHLFSIFLVTIIIIVLVAIINIKLKKADPIAKPKGILLLAEIFVTGIHDFVKDASHKMVGIAPYIAFLSIFLLLSNLLGLIGFVPPTANLTVTLTLGIITFILIQYHGFKQQGLGRLKGWAKPFFMFPINIIGELALPISLGFRLFGNILGGAIILTLVYGALGLLFSSVFNLGAFGEVFAAPFAWLFHGYFDLFAGLIQTFIFVLLTTIFLSLAIED